MDKYEVAFSCLEKDADSTKRPWMECAQVKANNASEAIEKAKESIGYDEISYFIATLAYVKKI